MFEFIKKLFKRNSTKQSKCNKTCKCNGTCECCEQNCDDIVKESNSVEVQTKKSVEKFEYKKENINVTNTEKYDNKEKSNNELEKKIDETLNKKVNKFDNKDVKRIAKKNVSKDTKKVVKMTNIDNSEKITSK